MLVFNKSRYKLRAPLVKLQEELNKLSERVIKIKESDNKITYQCARKDTHYGRYGEMEMEPILCETKLPYRFLTVVGEDK